jgi:T-complex protein 1 subunit eta
VNTFDTYVWEPSVIKLNAIAAATEAACMILSIDETVKQPKKEEPGQQPIRGGQGHGHPH